MRAPVTKSVASTYARRVPEETILYDTVRDQLETFLGCAEAAGRSVPAFVERELRAYLKCGILAHGFVRLECAKCGSNRLVAFSCKGRGFCPSCGGRRMAETAAFLVDHVLPFTPVRQWVLSLPIALRYRLAYDSGLAADVLQVFIRAVFTSLRRRARHKLGPGKYECGAITFVQRFGDALNLNLHYHSIVLDGVYLTDQSERSRFRPLPEPRNEDVERVTRQIVRRLRALLVRRSLTADADIGDADPLAADEPLLAKIYAASVQGHTAMGPRAGRRLLRMGELVDPEESASLDNPRCTSIDGVSLHANVAVPARDRRRLERLCRYVTRPPIATQRLSRLDDGRLLYRLKRRWRDGTTHVVYEPMELVEKLAGIIPPPRCHMTRYHGVLAPRAALRHVAVNDRVHASCREEKATPRREPSSCHSTPHAADRSVASNRSDRGRAGSSQRCASREPRERSNPPRCTLPWIPWAELMRRVFAVDVLQCPACGGAMRVLAVIHPPDATREILESMGLSARAPPLAPSRVEHAAGIETD